MHLSHVVRRSLLSLSVVAAVALPSVTRADEKSACLTAFDDAQRLRAAGNLVDALDRAKSCARDVCPNVVKPLCAGFVTDIQSHVASISIDVRDETGAAMGDATAHLDGHELPSGKALTVEPGTHKLRVEHPRASTVEQSITVKGGETRTVTIVLTKKPLAPIATEPSASAAPSAAPADSAPTSPGSTRGVLPYVFGGVGVLGVASFAFFGLSGKSQQHDLQSSCAPYCSTDDVSPVRQKYLVADISLLVGVASLGVATWLFLSPSSPSQSEGAAATPSVHLGVAAVPGNAVVSLSGSM